MGGEPMIGMQLPGGRGPQAPPPGIDLSKEGCLAGLGEAATNRRKGDGSGPLPDVPVHPGSLGGVITPLEPPVPPMLPMGSDRGRHLLLSIEEEGVELCLGREVDKPGLPRGGNGLGTNQGFEDEVKAVG